MKWLNNLLVAESHFQNKKSPGIIDSRTLFLEGYSVHRTFFFSAVKNNIVANLLVAFVAVFCLRVASVYYIPKIPFLLK